MFATNQPIELPNVAGESPSTPILSVLSNTLTNGLLSSYGALAHFLPLTPTNIPRNSHRGFFLPRISKYRKGDRFSTWHEARACLLSPIPARGKHNVGQCDHFKLKIARGVRGRRKRGRKRKRIVHLATGFIRKYMNNKDKYLGSLRYAFFPLGDGLDRLYRLVGAFGKHFIKYSAVCDKSERKIFLIELHHR